MTKKTIAFFGDSFVASYYGWIEDFCIKNNYECLHTGKPGADQFYSFEKWQNFNDKEKFTDVCVYSHTNSNRLYHPHKEIPLVPGVVFSVLEKKMKLDSTVIDDFDSVFKSARDFFIFLNFKERSIMQSQIVPYGIDRLMKERNKVFGSIIHIWSFAQNRKNFSKNDWAADPFWDLIYTESGTNVLLDLSNLSAADPKFHGDLVDYRPNHFSLDMSSFIVDLLETAINQTNFKYGKKAVLDFTPYVGRDSVFQDYVSALEKIKKQLI